MSHKLKIYSVNSAKFLVLVLLAFVISYHTNILQVGVKEVRAQSSNILSGYAWSDNVGWISFSGSNYGVLVDQGTGSMSGYVWSDNIGWVSFNPTDVAGCPSAPCSPIINSGTGAVTGWAKALSADGNGWDGWIQLSGPWSPSVSFSSGAASGYSWGSNVVGWISWSGSGYGVMGTFAPTATLSANPPIIDQGQSSALTWSSTNATSCTGTGFTAGGSSGTSSTGALNTPGTSNYQVVCTGAGGTSAPAFASVEVLAPSVTISASPTRVHTGANSQISWSASGVSSCTVSGPSGTLASGNANSNRDFSTGSPRSVSISFQSIFTITCTTNGSPVSNSVTINVVPVFNEF